jgi:hypothetical protein
LLRNNRHRPLYADDPVCFSKKLDGPDEPGHDILGLMANET